MTEQKQETPEFEDSFFRIKDPDGTYRIIDAPNMPSSVSDVCCAVQRCERPLLSLARAGACNVGFVCVPANLFGEVQETLNSFKEWHVRASVLTRHMGKGVVCGAPKPHAPRLGVSIEVTPQDAEKFDSEAQAQLQEQLVRKEVVALGPLQLDVEAAAPMDEQENLFMQLATIAVETDMPILVHSGQLAARELELLRSAKCTMKNVLLLNRTLGSAAQQPWVDAGCMVAFDGHLTYEHRSDLHEAAASVPLEQLLCASGEPDIAPEPVVTVPGGPEDILFAAGKLCEVRGSNTFDDFIPFFDALRENAQRFFGL